MGMLKKLFSARNVSLRELKLTLLGHERRRRQIADELRTLEKRKTEITERARIHRRRGSTMEVDYLWRELKQLRTERSLLERDAQIVNLETLALKRTIHGMERLEAQNDKTGVRRLLSRVRQSGLDDKLAATTIRDEDYLRELESILEDSGIAADASTEDDPEKAAFLAELDVLNATLADNELTEHDRASAPPESESTEDRAEAEEDQER